MNKLITAQLKIYSFIISIVLFLPSMGLSAVIVDSSVYSGTASSEFDANWSVDNLFDNTGAAWAINNTSNPQGGLEGWISVALSDLYAIDSIRYAPRAASGIIDGTESMHVWISDTDFGVNVQNAGETAAFWADNFGSTDLTVNNFADAAAQDYALDSGTTQGQYLLARFIGWNDGGAGNVGGSTFLIDGDVVVPEPTTFALMGVALGVLFAVRRKVNSNRR